MLLRDISNSQSDTLFGRQLSDVPRVQHDRSAKQRQLADDGFHQRGFAGAIAAKDSDAAAPRHIERDAEQDLTTAVAGVEIPDIEISVFRHGGDKPPEPWRWLESPVPSRNPARCPGQAPAGGPRCRE